MFGPDRARKRGSSRRPRRRSDEPSELAETPRRSTAVGPRRPRPGARRRRRCNGRWRGTTRNSSGFRRRWPTCERGSSGSPGVRRGWRRRSNGWTARHRRSLLAWPMSGPNVRRCRRRWRSWGRARRGCRRVRTSSMRTVGTWRNRRARRSCAAGATERWGSSGDLRFRKQSSEKAYDSE